MLFRSWHPEGHVSFASSHAGSVPFSRMSLPYGEQLLWPDHCVEGTQGAEFHPALQIPFGSTVVRKGTRRDIDSYSAFLENDHMTLVGLDALLRGANVSEITLAGLATDFCVLHTALDARTLGYEVIVIEDACRGIDADGSLERARNSNAPPPTGSAPRWPPWISSRFRPLAENCSSIGRGGKFSGAAIFEVPHDHGDGTGRRRGWSGPVLGPYGSRSDALGAERKWLSSCRVRRAPPCDVLVSQRPAMPHEQSP